MDEDTANELGSMASVLTALAAAPAELLPRGTMIDDQYRIERVLGHGAMGVVYLARDLRLDRDLAIKLARERSAVALARSSREALALARVSHPNVVVIHQVGQLDGRVYVAMEYVAGQTARTWCNQRRTVREIVQLYGAVGQGLAAAHAAGLIHRDFKPDNVLVGDDGRARVADFGLANTTTAASDSPGAVAGTPAYMAPEQVRGEALDARADQFAFCVALWEALHRTLPFPPSMVATLSGPPDSLALARGEPARARRVPRHLELALRRGLAPDRERRWPSMTPLLDELRRDPARRRRGLAIGGAAALGAVGLALALRPSSDPALDTCAGGASQLAPVWSPARGARLHAVLAAAGAPAWLVRAAGDDVATIDDWSTRWIAQHRAVCQAIAWTPALRDRGMDCLARGQHTLEASLARLEDGHADAHTAQTVIDQLPRPEACADPAYLQALVPPPTDPAIAAQVADVRREIVRVRLLALTNGIDPVEDRLQPAAAAIATFPPLAAEVHYSQAFIANLRGDDQHAFPMLRDAYFEARNAGDRVTATMAASSAVLSLLNLSRDDEADDWGRLAEVEAHTVADPKLQMQVFDTLAVAADDHNQPERAIALADQELALARAAHRPAGEALRARGNAYALEGKYDLALADLEAAAADQRRRHGERYPELSPLDDDLALLLVRMGRTDDAIAAAQRALANAQATTKPESDFVNAALGALAVALGRARRFPEALAMLDRSMAIDRTLDGEHSYNVASDHNNRCQLLTQALRFDEATVDGRAAIAIWTETLGADAHEVGLASYNLAAALIAAGHYDLARTTAGRAATILGQQADSPEHAQALIVLGEADAHFGHRADARRELERAIAILGPSASDPDLLASAQLELARLELTAGHAAAARTLATTARDSLRAHHDHREADAEELLVRLGPHR